MNAHRSSSITHAGLAWLQFVPLFSYWQRSTPALHGLLFHSDASHNCVHVFVRMNCTASACVHVCVHMNCTASACACWMCPTLVRYHETMKLSQYPRSQTIIVQHLPVHAGCAQCLCATMKHSRYPCSHTISLQAQINPHVLQITRYGNGLWPIY